MYWLEKKQEKKQLLTVSALKKWSESNYIKSTNL